MFRRRERRPIAHRMREAVWPALGWRRWFDYFRHRVGRMPGTPYAIAAGFAFGAAVSFTPFMGFHLLLSAGLAYVARASVLAALAGTIVGNPWTFPIIWVGVFNLGNLILGLQGDALHAHHLTFGYLIERPWQVLLPMTVGGLTVFGFVWAAVYFPLRRGVAAYQRRRFLRRQRKAAAAEAATAPHHRPGARPAQDEPRSARRAAGGGSEQT